MRLDKTIKLGKNLKNTQRGGLSSMFLSERHCIYTIKVLCCKIKIRNENKFEAVHMTTGEMASVCREVRNGRKIISSLTVST